MKDIKRVSIVIPCKNEEKYISRCLKSIINSSYSKDLIEVFICDGKSQDSTIDIASYYTSNYPFIKILYNENETTPYGLNLGIKNSTGDVIIILGAHSEIQPDYIKNCLRDLDRDKNIACVGGYIDNIYENDFSRIISYAMSSRFGVGNAYFRTGRKNGFVDTVAFGAYRREVFEKIGLFDEDLIRNQDDEFNYRVIRNGYKIFLSNKIKSKYYVRGSWEKLFKQYYQYGYWKIYVNRKHKTITSKRQIIPLFFFLFLVFGLFLSFINKSFFYLFIGIIILYFISALLFSFEKTKGFSNVSKLMITFFILHLSYGLGYLEGILDFLVFNKKPNLRNSELSR